jgi:hypothetical protein
LVAATTRTSTGTVTGRHGLELVLLQDPQQLRLPGERHAAHLVRKIVPLSACLKRPRPERIAPVNRHVAEQPLSEGLDRAAQFTFTRGRGVAVRVDRVGDDLLARRSPWIGR